MTKPCILIVDDDRLQIAKNKIIFEHAGFQTLQARTPDEAIDCCRYHHVDLLFTDLIMPGNDGIALYGILEPNNNNHCPAILQTAYLNPKVRQAAKEAGFYACLDKSASTKETLTCIRQALAHNQEASIASA